MESKRKKVVAAAYTILVPMVGAGITILIFLSELLAKPVPGGHHP